MIMQLWCAFKLLFISFSVKRFFLKTKISDLGNEKAKEIAMCMRKENFPIIFDTCQLLKHIQIQ